MSEHDLTQNQLLTEVQTLRARLAALEHAEAEHQQALRESEARFRTLFESAAIGIALGTREGRVFDCNPALARMLGYSREELRGMSYRQLTHPDDLAVEDRLFAEMVEGKRDDYTMEKRLLHKDGRELHNRVIVSRKRGNDPSPVFLIAVVEDLTERRRMEEEHRHAQKMEMVGRLAGGVAHEFNNLLTVISGYSNLLLERLPAQDSSRGPIHEILKSGDRAATLTQQLLAFSRRQMLSPVDLDLNGILTDMTRMFRALIGEQIELLVYLDPALGKPKADPGQIEQVVLQLVVNARDAMPGGGRMVLETRNVLLDDEYARAHAEVVPGYYAMLAVSDSGSGIEPAALAHLFEPFYTTKEVGQGNGLGLAAVYGIVKQSGGHIDVESQPGRGSTFKVFLPLEDQVVPTFEVQGELAQAPGGTETVLVAEDDEGIRRLTRLILETLGYQVHEARNGVEALRIAQQHAEPIHLLVTDVVMPQMGGRELAERLRQLRPKIKILYLSGYSGDTLDQQGVPGDGMGFLQKPFTPMALARRVREVLE